MRVFGRRNESCGSLEVRTARNNINRELATPIAPPRAVNVLAVPFADPWRND